MSEKIDEKEIEAAKSSLAKAETTTSHDTYKPILKCPSCGKKMDIPDDISKKMDADEEVTLPNCDCGTQFAISVEKL